MEQMAKMIFEFPQNCSILPICFTEAAIHSTKEANLWSQAKASVLQSTKDPEAGVQAEDHQTRLQAAGSSQAGQ